MFFQRRSLTIFLIIWASAGDIPLIAGEGAAPFARAR